MQKLHPRAVWLFYGWRGLVFFLFTVPGAISGLLLGAESKSEYGGEDDLVIIVALIAANVVFFVWSLIASKMYKFELKNEELFIEFGVFNKKNVNIPYARIQNVNVFRSFWARILGLSELQIQTAGSSNIEGKLPALGKDDAERIREELLAKASRNKGGGA